jgi:hypothetical protein
MVFVVVLRRRHSRHLTFASVLGHVPERSRRLLRRAVASLSLVRLSSRMRLLCRIRWGEDAVDAGTPPHAWSSRRGHCREPLDGTARKPKPHAIPARGTWQRRHLLPLRQVLRAPPPRSLSVTGEKGRARRGVNGLGFSGGEAAERWFCSTLAPSSAVGSVLTADIVSETPVG